MYFNHCMLYLYPHTSLSSHVLYIDVLDLLLFIYCHLFISIDDDFAVFMHLNEVVS